MIALKDSLGSDFVERVRRFLPRRWPAREGAQFRISAGATGDGGGGRAGAGGRAPSRGRSRHRRRQIACLSRPGDPLRDREKEEGDHFDAYDQSPGTAAAQGHPDREKDSPGRVRGRAHERPAELSLSAAPGARDAECERTLQHDRASRSRPARRLGAYDDGRHTERSAD